MLIIYFRSDSDTTITSLGETKRMESLKNEPDAVMLDREDARVLFAIIEGSIGFFNRYQVAEDIGLTVDEVYATPTSPSRLHS